MNTLISHTRVIVVGLALTQMLVGSACTQPAPSTTGLPPGVFAGVRDLHEAPAGKYALDPDHAAVIARVSHLGYSHSVFRFDRVQGALAWDPADPSKSTLTAAVQTASIATNVKDFAAELAGDQYLKSAAFPQATFVSTAFRQVDATHGTVDGQFTLMGKTRPLRFDVEFVGAGKGFGGHPRLGISAHGGIKPQDFGLPPMLTEPIELVIDTEFVKS